LALALALAIDHGSGRTQNEPMKASSCNSRRAHHPAAAIGLVVLLVAPLLGCATDSFEKLKKQAAHAVVVLQRDQDADSLAAAAIIRGSYMFGNDPDSALSLMARATAVAPDRADLAWLRATMCQHSPTCDVRPLDARLRALDPVNGAGWMGELARAWTAKDDAGTNEALRAIAQTERVDIYYTTLEAKLIPKVAEAGSIPLEDASVAVVGALADVAIPMYASAGNACKGERITQADVLGLCQGVARALANGDAVTTEMVGLAIAKRVWPEDSPQWKAAMDARRVYEYRSKLLLEVDSTSGTWSMSRTLALCSQYRRQQDVFKAELIDAGKDPDPPGP
jgi:hypothetical protein